MKTKTKIIISIILIITLGVVGVIIQINHSMEDSENTILDAYANARISVIDHYFKKSSQELKNRVFDNAYWDDAVYNLENENKEWLKENITQYLYEQPTFCIDIVFLQKNDGNYVEVYGEGVEGYDFTATNTYKKAFQEKKIHQEYLNVYGRTYEIVAAPIITDDKQTNGILLLGRVMDEKFLEDLSQFIMFDLVKEVQIVNSYSGTNTVKYDGDLMELYYPIKDIENNKIAWIKIVYNIAIFDKIKLKIEKEIIVDIILVAVGVVGIMIVISNRFMNIIEEIIKQINSIAQGNYKERLEEKGSHEMIRLAKSINTLSEEIERRIKEQENNYLESVKTLVMSLEVKDAYTKGHSERVSFYAYHLGEAVGYKNIDTLVNAALVHDIGKIAIPEVILNKPGKLTKEEYEIMKTHPDQGYKILDASHMFKDIKYIIKYHHERYDGKGYPDGLQGEQIPYGARILAVADVFDALTSNRAYREAMSVGEAMEIIKKDTGTHFDPLLVEAFKEIIYELYRKVNL
ncbi:HD domain-containing phosphohydrolase [Crassaminicella profunda]|uniref:HD domain-containing phosphohydrolase n=1 Tax=Crassaminicella profunda TaxID=1286698 RepID=UPI001CA70573|nr:HD domain-containing phosphohydrolase [Crassaminicella profunda]QZY55207.1 HD domain-containing protein [Crassaminicella profunda]